MLYISNCIVHARAGLTTTLLILFIVVCAVVWCLAVITELYSTATEWIQSMATNDKQIDCWMWY